MMNHHYHLAMSENCFHLNVMMMMKLIEIFLYVFHDGDDHDVMNNPMDSNGDAFSTIDDGCHVRNRYCVYACFFGIHSHCHWMERCSTKNLLLNDAVGFDNVDYSNPAEKFATTLNDDENFD